MIIEYREIVRLKTTRPELSNVTVASSVGSSRNTVSEVWKLVQDRILAWAIPEAVGAIPYQHIQFNEKYHAYAASPKLDNVLDQVLSTATGGKNNLPLIRKLAYTVLRLVIIKEHPKWRIQRMVDYFSDYLEMAAKYIYCSSSMRNH